MVSDVRGKIGGTVFARGSNGSYIRTFAMPRNANSFIQQVKRNDLSYYSQKWRNLANADRKAWIMQAVQAPYKNRVGDTSYYSGFQLYMRTNLILESAAMNT